MMAAALLDKEQYSVQICAEQILPQLRDTTELEFQICDDTAASCSSRVVTLGSITSVFHPAPSVLYMTLSVDCEGNNILRTPLLSNHASTAMPL